jgi:hypothetical protein
MVESYPSNPNFLPFILNNLKDKIVYDEFNDLKINSYDDFEKRGMIIQSNTNVNDDEIIKISSKLLFYTTLMNNYKTSIDWDAIEHVIESDFLTK